MRGETAITVYYDGLCPVCSREVALYRRLDSCGQIGWRDLAGPDDVLREESFTRHAALDLLHVRDSAGMLHVGLDAHVQMWQRLPGFRMLAWILQRSGWARRLIEALYLAFTRRRPGLVLRKRAAERSHG